MCHFQGGQKNNERIIQYGISLLFQNFDQNCKTGGCPKFPLADELVFSEKNFVSIKPLKRNTWDKCANQDVTHSLYTRGRLKGVNFRLAKLGNCRA